jgi:hypothetical protein
MNNEVDPIVLQALKLIIIKSDSVASVAASALRSPDPAERLSAIAHMALQTGDWTEDERAVVAEALLANSVADTATRNKVIVFRVTQPEHEAIIEESRRCGVSVSEYVRAKLDLAR